MHSLPFALSEDWHQDHLIVIFAFVIVIVLIKSFFRMRRAQLWHETARIALEKGQPIPDAPLFYRARFAGGGRCGWGLYRGLILIALGVGFYLVDAGQIRRWAPLPICVGAAMLIASLAAGSKGSADSETKDGPPTNR